MKLAFLLLLGIALANASDMSTASCASYCETGFSDGCACDPLCPIFGDCCDDVMSSCGVNPDVIPQVDVGFDVSAVSGSVECGDMLEDENFNNMEGTSIYRMLITSAEVAAQNRYTVDACDAEDDSVRVSVLKPMMSGNVEEQCDLVWCSCTFETTEPGPFFVVVYSLSANFDDGTDTETDTQTDTDTDTDMDYMMDKDGEMMMLPNYNLAIDCQPKDDQECVMISGMVADSCPTIMDGDNRCITTDGIDASCCAAFVDYYQQCANTVSTDAGLSTMCATFESDDKIGRFCSADQVVEFATTLADVSLDDINDDFLDAFLNGLSATIGVDRASMIVSGVREVVAKQGGVAIDTQIISDQQTQGTGGGSVNIAEIVSSVENIDTTTLASNLNTAFEAAALETTVSAEALVVEEPVVEAAVASASSTPSPSGSPSATASASTSGSVTASASTSASITASASPSAAVTPSSSPSTSVDACVGQATAINDACLTEGCLNTEVAVGDNCCEAVNTYVDGCSGYTFDDSCSNHPGTVAAMYAANCIGTSTSAASVPAVLGAAALAVVAFAVRA